MGIWSCIGTTKDEVAESLRMGRVGLGNNPDRLAYGYQSDLTGIVPEPELKPLLHRRLRAGLPGGSLRLHGFQGGVRAGRYG